MESSLRPFDYAEHALITGILEGRYSAGSTLPAERQLATLLGVPRPTLREVLRRLERDGWVTVQHGKSTVVNDYLRDGGLNILSSMVRFSRHLPSEFVPNLLQVRLDLAPTYTRLAIENEPDAVIGMLEAAITLEDTAAALAQYDWEVHRCLTISSGNPVYALILNGFAGFYAKLAVDYYFELAEAREASRLFYLTLRDHAIARNTEAAAELTRLVMQASIALWYQANLGED